VLRNEQDSLVVAQGPRYAIYYVPAPGSDLFRFGSTALGYDCYTGANLGAPVDLGIDPATWEALTEEPQRYGFHATLKAPFHLAPSYSEAHLVHALTGLTARMLPVVEPVIAMLSGFIAILPAKPCPAADALAADCTRLFDRFRAALNDADRARRLAAGLSRRQIEYLDRWGYPYVFDDFRFHMTLTGRIESSRAPPILTALQQAFARSCGRRAITIDRVSLVRQDHPDDPFRVIVQAALAAAVDDDAPLTTRPAGP
jgi:putative phosphonate metabolism protein